MEPVGIFLLLGILFGLIYVINGDQIYGTKEKHGPWTHRIDTHLQRFFGIFFGWMMMWFLLDRKLDIFCHMPLGRVTFVDLTIFLFALIGIFGFLPLLLHNLVTLFGHSKKA